MKRILLLTSLILLVSTGITKGQAALLVLIFGEKVATENFYFSIKAGFNYSVINGLDEGKNRTGANFGLVNNIRINDKLYLTPEFLPLSQKGVRDVPIVTTGNPELDSLLVDPSSTDRKLGYIDIPVLLKVMLTRRLSVAIGPQISFRTSAVDVYKSSPINGVILTTELDIKEAISPVDIGAVLDVNYKISEHMAGKGLELFFRVNQGFMNIFKNSEDKRTTQTTFQVGVALPFIENKTE